MKESVWYALTADRLLKFSFIFRAPFNAEAQVANGIKEKGKRKLARCQKAGPGEYDWLLNYLQRFVKVQPQSQLDYWKLLEDASLLTHLLTHQDWRSISDERRNAFNSPVDLF